MFLWLLVRLNNLSCVVAVCIVFSCSRCKISSCLSSALSIIVLIQFPSPTFPCPPSAPKVSGALCSFPGKSASLHPWSPYLFISPSLQSLVFLGGHSLKMSQFHHSWFAVISSPFSSLAPSLSASSSLHFFLLTSSLQPLSLHRFPGPGICQGPSQSPFPCLYLICSWRKQHTFLDLVTAWIILGFLLLYSNKIGL